MNLSDPLMRASDHHKTAQSKGKYEDFEDTFGFHAIFKYNFEFRSSASGMPNKIKLSKSIYTAEISKSETVSASELDGSPSKIKNSTSSAALSQESNVSFIEQVMKKKLTNLSCKLSAVESALKKHSTKNNARSKIEQNPLTHEPFIAAILCCSSNFLCSTDFRGPLILHIRHPVSISITLE